VLCLRGRCGSEQFLGHTPLPSIRGGVMDTDDSSCIALAIWSRASRPCTAGAPGPTNIVRLVCLLRRDIRPELEAVAFGVVAVEGPCAPAAADRRDGHALSLQPAM
jgi:hypothetical protein